jgi:Protein of unknown function (DUF2612)
MPIIEDYTSLITSEHNTAPNYVATVSLSCQPMVDQQNLVAEVPGLFDIDSAVGQQLDYVGQWVGLTRYVNVPLDIYFSWGVAGLGWGQGVWYSIFDPTTGAVALDDPHYRILLKARIVANQWDGTITGAYDAWDTLFAPEGFGIIIQCGAPQAIDYFSWGIVGRGWGQAAWYQPGSGTFYSNGNMTITLALLAPAGVAIDPVTQALFVNGLLGLKSAGVNVANYAIQSVPGKPIFGWGCGGSDTGTFPPTKLAGWGLGCWPILTPGN